VVKELHKINNKAWKEGRTQGEWKKAIIGLLIFRANRHFHHSFILRIYIAPVKKTTQKRAQPSHNYWTIEDMASK